ncbi:hypothetical protein RO3G_06808 [Lichtheimia corymbifera JMRC:FSU:9682]|uniref:SET domain-containing protein n=1 Tax=Lichtheimia corymbifera JMRC:FSU:9682 TaxID=1263082 RepID=A0A068RW95_9FUNG|nr:hypothetical protein RO3G_06808 [Lichtheimia corymbifera JMRC:FSU:9682]
MAIPLERYIQWLRDNGATFDKFDFKTDQDGIGSVYASQPVEENETLATLPFRLAITEPVARRAFPSLHAYSCRAVMSAFVAQQKNLGSQSFYAPYLDVLPPKIMTTLFFDDDDMRFIENTALATATVERKASIYEEYQKLSKEPGVDNISWDDYLWAYCVLSSRSFPYKLIDPTKEDIPSEVLFPLLDALNHKPNTRITWMRSGDEETGTLSFVTGQPANQGQQLFNNYGPKYNEYDHFAIKPNFSQDPNGPIKLNLLSQANIVSGNDDPLLNYVHRQSAPDSLWKLMRVLVMNETEISYYANCTDASMLDFVGYRNELAMLNTTQSLLQFKLMNVKRLPVSRDQAAKPWQQYALMYRDGQEDVLKSILSMVEQRKQSVLKTMAQDTIAPNAPFLKIVNPEHFSTPREESSSMVMLENVTISLKQLLQRNPTFKNAVDQLFEDIEEEEDIVFMLALIQERSKGDKSKWHDFFNKTSLQEVDPQTAVELQELYSSLFPAFTDAVPDVFHPTTFTFEALLWADNVLNTYSLSNPLVLVPK